MLSVRQWLSYFPGFSSLFYRLKDSLPMNAETALQVFFELHSDLPREGPGNNAITTQAFSLLPSLPPQPQILDLGCGPGMQTVQLAKLTDGHITAVDLHQPYLDQLRVHAEAEGVSDRITLIQADMGELSFSPGSFDLIWSEGAAYILEFATALRNWQPLLKPFGCLAVSELSWFRLDSPQPVMDFWQEEYPNIQSNEANLKLIRQLNYHAIAHFCLPEEAWWQHYYTPLEKRIQQIEAKYAENSDALKIIESHRQEIDLYRQYSDYYGYVFYILQANQSA